MIVTGSGGVGKTTLVDSWIQSLLKDKRVEKVLSLDLQGFGRFADLQFVPPEKVLEIFLARLGRRMADIPISLPDRAQLFRDTVEAIPRKTRRLPRQRR